MHPSHTRICGLKFVPTWYGKCQKIAEELQRSPLRVPLSHIQKTSSDRTQPATKTPITIPVNSRRRPRPVHGQAPISRPGHLSLPRSFPRAHWPGDNALRRQEARVRRGSTAWAGTVRHTDSFTPNSRKARHCNGFDATTGLLSWYPQRDLNPCRHLERVVS